MIHQSSKLQCVVIHGTKFMELIDHQLLRAEIWVWSQAGHVVLCFLLLCTIMVIFQSAGNVPKQLVMRVTCYCFN